MQTVTLPLTTLAVRVSQSLPPVTSSSKAIPLNLPTTIWDHAFKCLRLWGLVIQTITSLKFIQTFNNSMARMQITLLTSKHH